MNAIFDVTYASGRTETLSARGPKAIKAMRADLERAKALGGVSTFSEKTFETEEQAKADLRKQAATFLRPETVRVLQERAIANTTSVSQEIAKLVENA